MIKRTSPRGSANLATRAQSGDGLVVPVNLVAFCVGDLDRAAASQLAGTTVDYANQAGSNNAFLGSNVDRSYDQAALAPLERGIHLHWALPDALTNAQVRAGESDDGGLKFPAVPNRWLVTRFILNGAGTPSVRSWVVRSDALSATRPSSGPAKVTVPVNDGVQNYRWLGARQDLATYDPQVDEAAPRDFVALTGAEINAASNGVVTFAAYYPECRSAFGFVDTMNDVQGTALLMYVVTGWFDLAANDPASRAGRESLRQSYGWSAADPAPPGFTLHNGVVQSVAWNPSTVYLPPQAPIQAKAGLGNNPAESIAAYFNTAVGGAPLTEELLTAFQEGSLSSFIEPQPNQLAELAEAIHALQFAAIDGGQIFSVVVPGDVPIEVTTLPPAIAFALNSLNEAELAWQAGQDEVSWTRWQLFADWYRIFMATDPDTANDAYQVAVQRYRTWTPLQSKVAGLKAERDSLQTTLRNLLPPGMELTTTPAPRYWAPAEPSLLLASNDLAMPARYGGDGDYTSDGSLVTRKASELLTRVVVGSRTIDAVIYAGITALPPTLPYFAMCQTLLGEALVLNCDIASALTGLPVADLKTSLGLFLAARPQTQWQAPISGQKPPSPVGMTSWAGTNPWLPLFVHWKISYLPLQSTGKGSQVIDYRANLFTSNYTVDHTAGGNITYAPGPDGIHVDPSTAVFDQIYEGVSILSRTAADNFAKLVAGYIVDYPHDDAMKQIAAMLQATATMVQPLSGFGRLLLQMHQALQLNIGVSSGNPYSALTQLLGPIIQDANSVGPNFNVPFNPIRAGWAKIALTAIDVFGQTRTVAIGNPTCAQSMITKVDGRPLQGVAYLQPRVAHPARLRFDWLSADGSGFEELNLHPAASPVCGWLMPGHLIKALFFYDQSGTPLGTLFLDGPGTRLIWQSAPGDNATINMPIDQVLADANPLLLQVGMRLWQAGPDFFRAFWKAIDTVHGTVSMPTVSSGSSVAVLVGRPVALVQANLTLELQGPPSLNLSFSTLQLDDPSTDNRFPAVKFPVVVGDIEKLDDGLIGYFRQAASGNGYDLSTFFSQGADAGASSGVVRPTQGTLLLTSGPNSPDIGPDPRSIDLLMLVDPRANVHATTGILPVQTLQIPTLLVADEIDGLDFSVPVAPVLWPAGPPAMVAPSEAGYDVSWITQVPADDDPRKARWLVHPDLSAPTVDGVHAYTPQILAEGWLRYNPTVLTFDLLNAAGKPVVIAGQPNSLTLTVTNRKSGMITFQPGSTVPERQDAAGSAFYVHFALVVADADVPSVTFRADGWSFALQSSPAYGNYWAAAPTRSFSLKGGESFTIQLANLKPAPDPGGGTQARVYFDYYRIDGVADGIAADRLIVQASN